MSATATAGKGIKQELPPKGGYGPIQIERIKLRSIFGAKSTFAFLIASTCAGMYAYHLTFKQIRREEIEMRSARFAIWPLLLAERDRIILKQMRRNRDEEAELMKNVERWEVGTYYGEPIYFLDDADQYRDPTFFEHFAHTDPKIYMDRVARHLFT
ncbi:PREDICTED: NADH dehydrogenase [ubiquinone] 1 alpha subcomplex subunit 13 [Dinoponera quadriceps]|uniref:NADH dehydrogenase [ubiquinone] 1 alpha subcomplex subunit 13 n=1 Tax=Dinoponera quadriceps TaxID=609295 RepID=A0A6P3XPR3_DINQU|nr:PREDICTED: NADH dehydrogenase [ubiquinone] 1 alpha subcomplex subunit 13 [Dinoponera quadriceps]